jgi:hypothetical protein
MAALDFPASPSNGQLYSANNTTWRYSTSTSSWSAVKALDSAIVFSLDAGSDVLTTGVKFDFYVPFNATITEWVILANETGSVVIDVWKDTYGNYPPTNADSITASAKPTVTSALKAQSSTLTGWTTSLDTGQTLRINVDSVTSIKKLTLVLKIIKI